MRVFMPFVAFSFETANGCMLSWLAMLVNPWPLGVTEDAFGLGCCLELSTDPSCYAIFPGDEDRFTDCELSFWPFGPILAELLFLERFGSVMSDKPLMTRVLGSGEEPRPNMASCMA